jgi:hypothetical protein
MVHHQRKTSTTTTMGTPRWSPHIDKLVAVALATLAVFSLAHESQDAFRSLARHRCDEGRWQRRRGKRELCVGVGVGVTGLLATRIALGYNMGQVYKLISSMYQFELKS